MLNVVENISVNFNLLNETYGIISMGNIYSRHSDLRDAPYNEEADKGSWWSWKNVAVDVWIARREMDDWQSMGKRKWIQARFNVLDMALTDWDQVWECQEDCIILDEDKYFLKKDILQSE